MKRPSAREYIVTDKLRLGSICPRCSKTVATGTARDEPPDARILDLLGMPMGGTNRRGAVPEGGRLRARDLVGRRIVAVHQTRVKTRTYGEMVTAHVNETDFGDYAVSARITKPTNKTKEQPMKKTTTETINPTQSLCDFFVTCECKGFAPKKTGGRGCTCSH